ncbi:MAG: energy transducer TonB [Proteobacteria bacterium]|nr:energy transducer TonB [Pseudomonadota bacterium]
MWVASFMSGGRIRAVLCAAVAVCAGMAIFPGAAAAQSKPEQAPASAPLSFGKLRPPRYPPQAVRGKVSGIVYLRVHADETGKIDDVQVDHASDGGKGSLQHAAIAAVKSWQFNPAMRDGHPVPGGAVIPFRFSIVGQPVPEFPQPGPQSSPEMPVLEAINVTGQIVNKRR